MSQPTEGAGPVPEPSPPPALLFSSVDHFVRDYLRHIFRHRRIDGQRTFWAADWWNYEEATARLEAMWRAFESLRMDPNLGPSMWWRDHADHHMAVLMSPSGPFGGCSGAENTTQRGDPLPYIPPPPHMYPDPGPIPFIDTL